MPRVRYLGFVSALIALTCSATACSTANTAGPGPGEGSSSGSPALASVASGRFVTPVDLDGGGLVVEPPGPARARLSRSVAEAMFHASSVVDGTYRFSIMGLGVATVANTVSSVGAPTSSTPSGGSPSSTAGAPAASGTSGTPGAAGTSGGEPQTGAASYNGRLAWVGIAWGAVQSCPSTPSTPAGPSTSSSTAATHVARYEAVLFDAQTGGSALAYTSGGDPPCGGRAAPPTVSAPVEMVSVPWRAVSSASTAVAATLPPCAQYFGWTQAADAGAGTVQVVATTPFGADCGVAAGSTRVIDDVIPLGAAQAQVGHADLGPVSVLHSVAAS